MGTTSEKNLQNQRLRNTVYLILLVLGTGLITYFLTTIVFKPSLVYYSGNTMKLGSQIEIDPFKRIDWIISLFGILLTVLILGFSIFSLVIQNNSDKRIDRFIAEEKDRIQRKMDDHKNYLDQEIKNYKIAATLEENITSEIKKLFEEKYINMIFSYTRTFTKESLLLLPEYKDISYMILERTIRMFTDVLKECCDNDEIAAKVNAILLTGNFQLLTTSKLFYTSKDKEGEQEIMNGLDDIIANPFPEIKDYLLKMRVHYQNSTILPVIVRALEEIEREENH